MNRGVPPTAPNARTGELTPPGVTACARANSRAEASSVTSPSSQATRKHGRSGDLRGDCQPTAPTGRLLLRRTYQQEAPMETRLNGVEQFTDGALSEIIRPAAIVPED